VKERWEHGKECRDQLLLREPGQTLGIVRH
jgi:hypothetical protein